MTLGAQLVWLFVLAIPVACIAWTVTQEELFSEIHQTCIRLSKEGRRLVTRKFFYMLSCEYCFSHYVTILILVLTDFRLLLDDWRGYLIAGFSIVWIANLYMSLYGFIRVDLKKEKFKAKIEEKEFAEME